MKVGVVDDDERNYVKLKKTGSRIIGGLSQLSSKEFHFLINEFQFVISFIQ